MDDELPIISFEDRAALRRWLEANVERQLELPDCLMGESYRAAVVAGIVRKEMDNRGRVA